MSGAKAEVARRRLPVRVVIDLLGVLAMYAVFAVVVRLFGTGSYRDDLGLLLATIVGTLAAWVAMQSVGDRLRRRGRIEPTPDPVATIPRADGVWSGVRALLGCFTLPMILRVLVPTGTDVPTHLVVALVLAILALVTVIGEVLGDLAPGLRADARSLGLRGAAVTLAIALGVAALAAIAADVVLGAGTVVDEQCGLLDYCPNANILHVGPIGWIAIAGAAAGLLGLWVGLHGTAVQVLAGLVYVVELYWIEWTLVDVREGQIAIDAVAFTVAAATSMAAILALIWMVAIVGRADRAIVSAEPPVDAVIAEWA